VFFFDCLGGVFRLFLGFFGGSASFVGNVALVLSPRFTVFFFPGLVVFFDLFLLRLVLHLFVLQKTVK
jgi:hypothetical protein